MRLLGKLICAIKGHRRGKRIGMPVSQPDGKFLQMFKCERCGETHSRKVKVTT